MSVGTETAAAGTLVPIKEKSLLEKCLGRTYTKEELDTLSKEERVGVFKEEKTTLDLLKNLLEQLEKKSVTWDRNVSESIEHAIEHIDALVSRQLAAVLQDPKFQRLEGSYRGLRHLVMNSETGKALKIKVLTATKQEVQSDLDKAVEFDQSQLFKKIYEAEYGSPGGEPYGVLIGDYEFVNHPDDMAMLAKLSNVAAAAFCPFLSAASPQLFGFKSWVDLAQPRDLEKIFDSSEYIEWNSLRKAEDSRFLVLTLPRVLARLPYGAKTRPVEAFNFEEIPLNGKSRPVLLKNEQYTWMNAAYVLGTRLTDAFSQYRWCTAIRGAEGGGKVEGLPLHHFISDDGDPDFKCPTEIGITDRREAELDKLGFLALCHYKNQDYAVFFGSQTVQEPKKYDRNEATANAIISARLSYIMAASRFAHYIKVIARDKIGSFAEATDVEIHLQRWILNYVNANPNAGQALKAKYPLSDAVVQVQEVPGRPGSYNAVFWLRPWLQLEELTTSLRMVARIPKA